MLCVNKPTVLFYPQRRKIFRVPNKIHQTTMDAVAYTISTGVNKWSAKIEITGWARQQQQHRERDPILPSYIIP